MANQKNKRFEVVLKEPTTFTTEMILLDKETGVQYLLANRGYGAGFAPLLGPEGTPLAYRPPVREPWQ